MGSRGNDVTSNFRYLLSIGTWCHQGLGCTVQLASTGLNRQPGGLAIGKAMAKRWQTSNLFLALSNICSRHLPITVPVSVLLPEIESLEFKKTKTSFRATASFKEPHLKQPDKVGLRQRWSILESPARGVRAVGSDASEYDPCTLLAELLSGS